MAAGAHLCSLPLAFGGRSSSLKAPPVFCVSPRSGSEAWKARHCVIPRSEALRSGNETEIDIHTNGQSSSELYDKSLLEAYYERRNAKFIEGMSKISDMFAEGTDLLASLKCMRQMGAPEIELFDSDEALQEALKLQDAPSETIIFEVDKDKFVPADFQDNEDLVRLLDEST